MAPAWGRNGAAAALAYAVPADYGLGGVQAVSAISPSANPK
jgi:hypothetical protein